MANLIKSLNPDLQEFSAPVLVPDFADYHDDILSEVEVRKACRNYQATCKKASLEHSLDLSVDQASFVEHYITPGPMQITQPDGEVVDVRKGTWMATMHIKSKKLWEHVKDGLFTGFSIQASCMKQNISKARTAGDQAEKEGHVAKKRLFDLDFSKEEHHVSLVGEAANATQVLVMKSKTPQTKEVDMDLTTEQKEEAMQAAQLILATKAREAAQVEELADLKKSKEAQDTELADLRKAKEAQDKDIEELAELRKAKDEAETVHFVSKAKEFKVEDADTFGGLLKKCKGALEDAEYEMLETQLGKLGNIVKSKELLKPAGEINADELVKTKDELVDARVEELLSKSKDVKDTRGIFKQARLEVTAELAAAAV